MNYREIVLRYVDWLTFSFGANGDNRLRQMRRCIVESANDPKTEVSVHQSQYEAVFIHIMKNIYLPMTGKNMIFNQIIIPALQDSGLDIKEINGIKHAFKTGTRII